MDDEPVRWRLIEALTYETQLDSPVSGTTAYNVGTIESMPVSLPPHIAGLLAYLSHADERANEDLALRYFRHLYPEGEAEHFTRQSDASNSDGYVPGRFVLELKGSSNDWHAGLFQGLAYHKQLDFALIVVAAQGFLAQWRVDKIPQDVRDAVEAMPGAPNVVGRKMAAKYKSSARTHLALSECRVDVPTPLLPDTSQFISTLRLFEARLRAQKRVRLRLTLKNFPTVLGQLASYFITPMKALRAFYSMIYAWNAGSRIQLSPRHLDEATLSGDGGGEAIKGLLPGKRDKFKETVESYAVYLKDGECHDDFFARYDEALTALAPKFRTQNGIFFTDLDLSKFVLWLAKTHVPDLGKNYLVIDPACGSGNLVTNWRSPLELRHKVVSEIESELLFAVERRMQGDSWHNGRFTVIPKVDEDKGLNFLEFSAKQYLGTLTKYLKDSGIKPDRPIAFLCNPPYRSDDDQAAEKNQYPIHPSILELTGEDAGAERYCCFLAQMKLICREAEDSGLPGDSLLLLFTKTAWLTDRPVFERIRREVLGSFELEQGVLVDGHEFFDVKGKWPVAFTIWRYVERRATSRAEQSRAEQSRAEQSRAGQGRAEFVARSACPAR